jgi:hypothetical protein
VFVGITARYTDAGSAKVAEILLPEDDKAFSFTETPLPELIEAARRRLAGDARPHPGEPARDAAGQTRRACRSDRAAASGRDAGAGGGWSGPSSRRRRCSCAVAPPMVPIRVKDFAQEKIDKARDAAKKAETRIYDWMVECQYAGEARKVLFDSARLGVGVLKGPFPKPKRDIALSKEKKTIEIRETIKPAAKWVDPWNVFPLGACGENLCDGDGIFERDWLSERSVRELKKTPGYIVSQIDEVLKEGPDKINITGNAPKKGDGQPAPTGSGRYEIWYFTGTIGRDDMACIWQAAGKPLKTDGRSGRPQGGLRDRDHDQRPRDPGHHQPARLGLVQLPQRALAAPPRPLGGRRHPRAAEDAAAHPERRHAPHARERRQVGRQPDRGRRERHQPGRRQLGRSRRTSSGASSPTAT